MKILYLVPDLSFGGVTSVVSSLIRNLREKFKVEVLVVTLFTKNEIEIKDIEIVHLNISSISDVVKGVVFLNKIISDYEPDIVHSHTLYPHLFIDFISLLYKKNYKLINSEHGTYNSKLKFYKRMNFFRILNSQADLVTNVSIASCKSYINANIVKRKKIKPVYNGIDIKQYHYSQSSRDSIRKALNIGENTKVIGYVGRLSKEKNVANLINAISLINSVDFKIIIIGDGPERRDLETLVSEKDLNNKVSFLGAKSNVNKYYSAFDILALSSNTEGLPTVILEAISSNCLVVSTDCGGVREILPENYEFLAKPNCPEELSLIINKMLEMNYIITNQIKKNCFQKINDYFTIEAMCQKWWVIYNET